MQNSRRSYRLHRVECENVPPFMNHLYLTQVGLKLSPIYVLHICFFKYRHASLQSGNVVLIRGLWEMSFMIIVQGGLLAPDFRISDR